jgi:hypothetical protein
MILFLLIPYFNEPSGRISKHKSRPDHVKSSPMKIKTFFLVAFLMMSSVIGLAQLTHEHSYTGTAEVADLGESGFRYYTTNYLTNSVLLYNEDHSYWKTIQLSVPQNQYLYDVAYVSSRLFNQDDQVELLMVTYSYVSTSDTGGYYIYNTRVVNEAGNLLADVPGGGYSFIMTTGNNVNKLIVYVYDFAVSEYIMSTEIFGLPDPVGGIVEDPASVLRPYPNPAGSEINIPLADAGHHVVIAVSDNLGRELFRRSAPVSDGSYRMDTSGLPAGTYYYVIETDGKSLPAKKFLKR